MTIFYCSFLFNVHRENAKNRIHSEKAENELLRMITKDIRIDNDIKSKDKPIKRIYNWVFESLTIFIFAVTSVIIILLTFRRSIIKKIHFLNMFS